MSLTQEVANFVLETEFANIPSRVIELAKRRILDTLGVALAGSREPVSGIVLDFVEESGGRPQSTILGHHLKSPSHEAALVNGTSAHAMDYDDAMLGRSLLGHPSATVVPSIFGTAEALPRDVPGKELLTAYVVGVEVLGWMGSVANPAHYDLGFHTTSTIGVLGTACASGKLLGLNNREMIQALGIAASMASGLRSNFGTMTKPLHAGLAARNGIIAARLAKKGLTSSASILEGDNGFLAAMARANPENSLHIDTGFSHVGGITVKPYPSCAATHAIIDSVIRLAKDHSLKAKDVSRIEIEVSSLNTNVLSYSQPKTGLEGKFSGQYCAAIALLRGRVSISDFEDTLTRRENVLDLENKTELRSNDRFFAHGSMGAAVTITTHDNHRFSLVCENPQGSPRNPIGDENLVKKYEECASGILDEEQVHRSIREVLELDKLGNLKDLVGTLTVS